MHTVGIYVAIMQEKVFVGSDDSFYNDFLQGIHLCKNFCNPTMAFEGRCKQLAAILAHSANHEDYSSKGQNVYPRESKLVCRKV